MSSSIMYDPHFARGCYHINRAFSLSRMYTNTETPCEQWVGSLKFLYNTVQGTTTATLTRRLRARCAGVRGAEMDREFLEKLAASLSGARRRRTGEIASRAVATFLEKSALQAREEARPLLQTASLSKPLAAASIKAAERESVKGGSLIESAVIEEKDLVLAKNITHRSGVASLPFAARSRQEWEKDIKMP
eukprot:10071883-Karenia_brevis.AAC.1